MRKEIDVNQREAEGIAYHVVMETLSSHGVEQFQTAVVRDITGNLAQILLLLGDSMRELDLRTFKDSTQKSPDLEEPDFPPLSPLAVPLGFHVGGYRDTQRGDWYFCPHCSKAVRATGKCDGERYILIPGRKEVLADPAPDQGVS